MAVRPINLWDNYQNLSHGLFYYNSNTNAFYSDQDCTNQITSVPIPRRSQYTFTGYRSTSSNTAILRVKPDGTIVPWDAGTSTSEIKIYARWSILSQRFYIVEPGESATAPWTIPDPQFFRAVSGGDLYRDDQLTVGPITALTQIPYRERYAFRGCWSQNSETGVISYNWIDENGNLLDDLRTVAASTSSSYARGLTAYWYYCYSATLNANTGTGGEINPIWYDRAHNRWCSDINLLNVISTVAKPTRAGYIFKGYYTAKSGGTQVIGKAGNIKSSWTSVTSANTTVYAQWASPVTITVNNGSGTGGPSALYYGGKQFFTSSQLTDPVTSVQVPTLANHRFLGYFSASSGGTQYIDADGTILASFAPSSAVTIYAQFERVSYTIQVQGNGGGGISALYANADRTGVYSDEQCTGSALSSITPLTRAGYRFMGLFQTNEISGTKLVDASGNFTAAMSSFVSGLSANATIYALWQQVHTITLDANGGEGSPAEIYFDDAYSQFYDDPAMTTPVTRITIPAKECYRFTGFSAGGTTYIDDAGNISGSWTPTGAATLTAGWVRRSYKLQLDPGTGGETTQPTIYTSGSGSTWYEDDALTTPTTTAALPTKAGYTFGGYYISGTQVVTAAGTITATGTATDRTATATWTANTYTITFDYNGGTGSTVSKQVTFGQPIGQLPTATRTRAYFTGWTVDLQVVTSSTVWNIPQNSRIVASWELQFGNVTDYFWLKSNALAPIQSDNGDNKQRICYSHTGRIDGAETSCVWRNPSVSYVVKANTTLRVTLGKAYAGSAGVSGYMIVGVSIETQAGQFPIVTVEAVANEGADAINKFDVVVPIVARAKAQNLLNVVSGGGRLNACSIRATCDPVVIAENMMPCASDVVNGKIELHATTIASGRENEPTAGAGFTSVGAPKQNTDAYYQVFNLTAEKEL